MKAHFLKVSWCTFIAGLLWVNLIVPVVVDAQNLDNQTPDITLPEENGGHVNLSSLKDHFVYVNFWASWCPNCDIKMPALKGIYQKYKDKRFKNAKGFKVFNVSLDTDKSDWKNMSRRYNLPEMGPNCCDGKGHESPAAKRFDVNGIPSSFLLNPDGTVISSQPSFAELDNLLSQNSVFDNLYYKIELGTFLTLDFHDFGHIKDLGEIEIEPTPYGHQVFLGPFYEDNEADRALQTVINQGYIEAKLIFYRDGVRADNYYGISAPYTVYGGGSANSFTPSPTPSNNFHGNNNSTVSQNTPAISPPYQVPATTPYPPQNQYKAPPSSSENVVVYADDNYLNQPLQTASPFESQGQANNPYAYPTQIPNQPLNQYPNSPSRNERLNQYRDQSPNQPLNQYANSQSRNEKLDLYRNPNQPQNLPANAYANSQSRNEKLDLYRNPNQAQNPPANAYANSQSRNEKLDLYRNPNQAQNPPANTYTNSQSRNEKLNLYRNPNQPQNPPANAYANSQSRNEKLNLYRNPNQPQNLPANAYANSQSRNKRLNQYRNPNQAQNPPANAYANSQSRNKRLNQYRNPNQAQNTASTNSYDPNKKFSNEIPQYGLNGNQSNANSPSNTFKPKPNKQATAYNNQDIYAPPPPAPDYLKNQKAKTKPAQNSANSTPQKPAQQQLTNKNNPNIYTPPPSSNLPKKPASHAGHAHDPNDGQDHSGHDHAATKEVAQKKPTPRNTYPAGYPSSGYPSSYPANANKGENPPSFLKKKQQQATQKQPVTQTVESDVHGTPRQTFPVQYGQKPKAPNYPKANAAAQVSAEQSKKNTPKTSNPYANPYSPNSDNKTPPKNINFEERDLKRTYEDDVETAQNPNNQATKNPNIIRPPNFNTSKYPGNPSYPGRSGNPSSSDSFSNDNSNAVITSSREMRKLARKRKRLAKKKAKYQKKVDLLKEENKLLNERIEFMKIYSN